MARHAKKKAHTKAHGHKGPTKKSASHPRKKPVMAKRKTATPSRSIVVRSAPAPRPIVIKQTASKPAKRGRRRHSSGGGGGGGGGLLSPERTGAMMGGFATAIIENSPMFAAIPTIPILGKVGTAGVIMYYLSKSNPSLRHATTGILAVAAYQLGKSQGAATQGLSGWGPGVAAVMP